jgi:hypothetical protein
VLATEIDMYIGDVDVCSGHFQLVPFASFFFLWSMPVSELFVYYRLI